jgi:hypothetical protein
MMIKTNEVELIAASVIANLSMVMRMVP